jgi:hypothetical protein
MKSPNLLEAYIKQEVAKSVERITMSPRVNNSDIYTQQFDSDSGEPEITDDTIMDRILGIFDQDAEQIKEPNLHKAEPMQVSPIPSEGSFSDNNPAIQGTYDTTSGLGNKEYEIPKRDHNQPFEFSTQFYNEDNDNQDNDNQEEYDYTRKTDFSTPIETSKPQKTRSNRYPDKEESKEVKLRKYLNGDNFNKKDLRELLDDE